MISATHTVEFLQKHGIGLKSLFAFLVIIFATLLPSLASMSSRWIGFYTKSREEKGTMKSTILFLLFMVIIMPVLGFTFGPDLFEFLVGNLENEFKDPTRWKCLCKKILIVIFFFQIIRKTNLFPFYLQFFLILVLILPFTLSSSLSLEIL